MAIKAKPKRRVSKRPEERREDLLDAAATVFAKKGVDDARIEEITSAAGVAKGTFYLYFKSKDDVAAALKQRLFAAWMEGMSSVPEGPRTTEDWWAIPKVLVDRMVDYMFDHEDLIQVITRDLYPRGRKDFVDFEATMLMALATGLEEGTRAGAYRVSDPLAAATMINHAIVGCVEHALMGSPPGLHRERVKAAAGELVRKVLAP